MSSRSTFVSLLAALVLSFSTIASSRSNSGRRAQDQQAAGPSFLLIAPTITKADETFTGIVIEKGEKGEKGEKQDSPLQPGDQVDFNGKVLDVKPGGVVTFPAAARAGGLFLLCRVRKGGGAPSATPALSYSGLVPHVTSVNAPPDAPCNVAHAAEIVSSRGPFRIVGQGLNKLVSGSLTSATGGAVTLPPSVGSSLQRIYYSDGQMPYPKGQLRFSGTDSNGVTHPAPNTSFNPTIKVTGTQVTFRGQRGSITVTTDVETGVTLFGGEPNITLDAHSAIVSVNMPARVGFRGNQAGAYNITVSPIAPDLAAPPPGAPKANSQCGTLQAHFDPATNTTTVSAPVTVTDAVGKPIPNCPVDVALTHPGGVEYAHTTTSTTGSGNVTFTVSRDVPVSLIATYPYETPLHAPAGEPRYPTNVGTPDKNLHHCESHKLLIIIGAVADESINNAAQWGLQLKNVEHKVFFKLKGDGSPDMAAPYVPTADNSTYERFTMPQAGKKKPKDGSTQDLVSTKFTDCCQFDQVMIVAHGGTKKLWPTLISALPQILDDRPVRKVALWICSSGDSLRPGDKDTYYEQLSYIFHPKDCSVPSRCGCDHVNCINIGEQPKCPDGTECVTILAAAWYDHTMQRDDLKGKVIQLTAKLGMTKNNDGSYGLTSPDGSLREIKVCRDGEPTNKDKPDEEPKYDYSIKASVVNGADVFAGNTVQADPAVGKATSDINYGQRIDPKDRLKDAKAQEPPGAVRPYTGPKKCAHPTHEGCLGGAV